jgi:hypothetical protein
MNPRHFFKFSDRPFFKSCDTLNRRLFEAKSDSPAARTGGQLFLPMATGPGGRPTGYWRILSLHVAPPIIFFVESNRITPRIRIYIQNRFSP